MHLRSTISPALIAVCFPLPVLWICGYINALMRAVRFRTYYSPFWRRASRSIATRSRQARLATPVAYSRSLVRSRRPAVLSGHFRCPGGEDLLRLVVVSASAPIAGPRHLHVRNASDDAWCMVMRTAAPMTVQVAASILTRIRREAGDRQYWHGVGKRGPPLWRLPVGSWARAIYARARPQSRPLLL